jgi:hypothetical protein
VVIVFFHIGLWAIKLSFLAYFQWLGQNMSNQKIVWWTTLAITVATDLASFDSIEYHCPTGSILYVQSKQ